MRFARRRRARARRAASSPAGRRASAGSGWRRRRPGAPQPARRSPSAARPVSPRGAAGRGPAAGHRRGRARSARRVPPRTREPMSMAYGPSPASSTKLRTFGSYTIAAAGTPARTAKTAECRRMATTASQAADEAGRLRGAQRGLDDDGRAAACASGRGARLRYRRLPAAGQDLEGDEEDGAAARCSSEAIEGRRHRALPALGIDADVPAPQRDPEQGAGRAVHEGADGRGIRRSERRSRGRRSRSRGRCRRRRRPARPAKPRRGRWPRCSARTRTA